MESQDINIYVGLGLMLLAFCAILTLVIVLLARRTGNGLRWRNPFPLIDKPRKPKNDLTIESLGSDTTDAEVLKYLNELPRKYRVFHDVYFIQKDLTMQIDHLVVSRQGVFLIETKNWTGTLIGNEVNPLWTVQYLGGASEIVQSPAVDMYAKSRFIARSAKISESLIHPILSFSNEVDTYYLNVNDKLKVIYHQQLVETITQFPWRRMSHRMMHRVVSSIKAKSPQGNGRKLEHLRFINRIIDIRNRA